MSTPLLTAAIGFLTFTAAACATSPGPGASPFAALGDGWVGGFGPLDDTGALLRVDFASGTLRLDPREELAPLGIVHGTVDRGGAIRFTAYEGRHRWSFELTEAGPGELKGAVKDPQAGSAEVRLFKADATDRSAVDAVLGGTYAVDGELGQLLFVENGRLFDTRDGSERRLFRLPGGRALVGAGVGTSHPAFGIARREGDGLRIEREGEKAVVATPVTLTKRELRFSSTDGVELQGTLTLPPGRGPFPTAVFVHGSGHSTRHDPWENAIARVLASEGFAMFLYDKRGVGDSGGEYVGPGSRDANNVSDQNLERLAADARAALATVASAPEVDPKRLGFLGLSQAGWIVPLAATRNAAVHFVIMVSTPTVPVATQLAYQTLNGDAVSCLPISESARLTRAFAPRTGVDPKPSLATLEVPGLWLFGDHDPLVPVGESMDVLVALAKPGFTVKLAPGAGHELFLVGNDTDAERQRSPGMSPLAIEALHAWLRAFRG